MLIATIVLGIILVAWGLWQLITVMRRNSVATVIDEETFTAGMRKAQVIDLREKKEFDAGHILGARNLPYSTFRANHSLIRPDLPVYLYDEGKALSSRVAISLGKENFKDLYILKGGYAGWQGKTKKAKY